MSVRTLAGFAALLLVGACAAPVVPFPTTGPTPTTPRERPTITVEPTTELPRMTVPPTTAPAEFPEPTGYREPETVHIGDAVVAIGNVIDPLEGSPKLCFELVYAGNFPGCGGSHPWVELLNFESRLVPGDEEAGDVFVSQFVEIHGTWANDGITVTSAEAVERTPRAPCQPPDQGWPALADSWEQDQEGVGTYTSTRRDDFGGFWIGRSNDEPLSLANRVLIVNTVRDPELVTDEIVSIYPSSMCVVQVQFSDDELSGLPLQLNELSDELSADSATWLNRVVVRPWIVTEEILNLVEPYNDRVLVEPKIRLDNGRVTTDG